MPAADLDEYLRKVTLEPITPRTIISKRRLREDLAASRQSGFAYSHEEFTPGIVGLATAVEHSGRFLGALNLAVPTTRYTAARDVIFRRQLSAVASSLGEIITSRS